MMEQLYFNTKNSYSNRNKETAIAFPLSAGIDAQRRRWSSCWQTKMEIPAFMAMLLLAFAAGTDTGPAQKKHKQAASTVTPFHLLQVDYF